MNAQDLIEALRNGGSVIHSVKWRDKHQCIVKDASGEMLGYTQRSTIKTMLNFSPFDIVERENIVSHQKTYVRPEYEPEDRVWIFRTVNRKNEHTFTTEVERTLS